MNIALIAMSGIRCDDRELAAFGLSLPGLLDRGRSIASMPSLALLTLAGMTPNHHRLRYIEVPNLSEIDDVPEGDFDLVAISSYTAQILEAYELADRFRKRKIAVAIGGPHVTMLPEEAAQHCDAVAIGEGEPIWLDILADAERGQLKQFYGSQFSSFSLVDAPLPAYHLLQPEKYNRLLVQTSRGCPHRCEFCAASILIAKRYKQKPAEKVLAEIDAIRAIWRRPFIEFADDNSFVNRAYWYDLLPELRTRQIRWFAETDISIAEDPRLLSLMYDAGCAQVLIGLESPYGIGTDGLELHANYKFRTAAKQKEAVRAIQEQGIRVIGCFVLGIDGQGADIGEQVLEYSKELGLFDVQITVQTAFPGTPLYLRMKAEGRLIEPENWNRCTLFDVNFHPANMTAQELRKTLRNLGETIYSDEESRARRHRFKEVARARTKCAAATSLS